MATPFMISSDSRQHRNLAVLLLVISLHLASIAAANYLSSHAGDKSAVIRPLTVQLVSVSVPSPMPQLETSAVAMTTRSKLPLSEKQLTPKPAAAPKPLIPAIKTLQTPVPEVQHNQKTMPDHVSAVSATTAESTVAGAAPTAAAAAKTSVSIPASYAASNRKPDYPKLSQRFEEQGTTVLRVLVQSDGSAGEVQITKSSGYALLDESARTAIRSWRFNPATSDGKAITEWYQISIPFTLQN
jgi:protein TonB